jgi:hypothetical protein
MRAELDELLYGYYGRLARQAVLQVRLTTCEASIEQKRQLLASNRFLKLRVTAHIDGAETHAQGTHGDSTANSVMEMIERKHRHEKALDNLIDLRMTLLDDLSTIAVMNADILIAFDYITADDKTLIELCFKCRKSFRAIGRELNVEASTVSDRIERLALDFPMLVKEIKSGNLPPRKTTQHNTNVFPCDHPAETTKSEEMLLSYS